MRESGCLFGVCEIKSMISRASSRGEPSSCSKWRCLYGRGLSDDDDACLVCCERQAVEPQPNERGLPLLPVFHRLDCGRPSWHQLDRCDLTTTSFFSRLPNRPRPLSLSARAHTHTQRKQTNASTYLTNLRIGAANKCCRCCLLVSRQRNSSWWRIIQRWMDKSLYCNRQRWKKMAIRRPCCLYTRTLAEKRCPVTSLSPHGRWFVANWNRIVHGHRMYQKRKKKPQRQQGNNTRTHTHRHTHRHTYTEREATSAAESIVFVVVVGWWWWWVVHSAWKANPGLTPNTDRPCRELPTEYQRRLVAL